MKLLPVEKINQSTDDFKALATSETATKKAYQDAIKKGLSRFAGMYLYLDTEDCERTCCYYEELMDIAGIKSSDGPLNHFMYDYDPNN